MVCEAIILVFVIIFYLYGGIKIIRRLDPWDDFSIFLTTFYLMTFSFLMGLIFLGPLYELLFIQTTDLFSIEKLFRGFKSGIIIGTGLSILLGILFPINVYNKRQYYSKRKE